MTKDNMLKEQYSTFELDQILNVSHSNLKQWMDRGFIIPSIKTAKGRGTRSIFSLEDVYRARIFQDLHRAGLAQGDAAELSQDILFDTIKEGAEWLFVIHGPHFTGIELLKLEQLNERIEEESGNALVLFNVGHIIKEVDHIVCKTEGKESIRKIRFLKKK